MILFVFSDFYRLSPIKPIKNKEKFKYIKKIYKILNFKYGYSLTNKNSYLMIPFLLHIIFSISRLLVTKKGVHRTLLNSKER